MAVLPGVLSVDPRFPDPASVGMSPSLLGFAETAPYANHGLVPTPVSGPKSHSNVTVPSAAVPGTKQDTIGKVWLDKIHLLPYSVDAGFVTDEVIFTIELFSTVDDPSGLRSDTCTALTKVQGTEIPITSGPDTPPFDVHAQTAEIYEITVPKDGAPFIDASLTWTFPTLNIPVWSLIGTRTLPPTYLHDYVEAFGFSYEYSTSVFRSGTAAETRVNTSPKPRHSSEARFYTSDERTARLMQAHIYKASQNPYPALIYPDASIINSKDLALREIYIDTTYRRFFVGGLAVVLVGEAPLPVAIPYTIAEVHSDKIVVSVDFEADDFSAGDVVIPAYTADITFGNSLSMLTTDLQELEYKASELTGGAQMPERYAGVVPAEIDQIDGRMLFDFVHNFRDSLDMEYQVYGSTHKLGNGELFVPKGDRGVRSYKLAVDLSDREEIWRLAGFFELARGRGDSFWFLPPQRSFDVVQIGTNTFKIETWTDISSNVGDPYEWVYFKDSSTGDYSTFKITDAAYSEVDDTMVITVDASIGISVLNVEEAGYASLVRFSSDRLEETWLTSGFCSFEIDLTEVIEEATVDVS